MNCVLYILNFCLLCIEEGDSEGLFLVRESPTVEGAFILSVVNEGQPRHYQINRHGTDAFFSIGKCMGSINIKAIFNPICNKVK